nr:unnamed protein product [Callosobruchus chinensis]
MKLGMAEK